MHGARRTKSKRALAWIAKFPNAELLSLLIYFGVRVLIRQAGNPSDVQLIVGVTFLSLVPVIRTAGFHAWAELNGTVEVRPRGKRWMWDLFFIFFAAILVFILAVGRVALDLGGQSSPTLIKLALFALGAFLSIAVLGVLAWLARLRVFENIHQAYETATQGRYFFSCFHCLRIRFGWGQ